jgi:predicted metalloprotease with PDZ domain
MRLSIFLLIATAIQFVSAQTNIYQISFENAVHHEAQIQAVFTDLKESKIIFQMSRSSPGRYALHEFAKNVYDVQVTNSKGQKLVATRPNPYQWEVIGHDGTINISYTLFADRADGTYSQIDETHAHLNIPATFMYVNSLKDRPVEINFKVREDLNWKVATQLKSLGSNKFYAPNLYYFMDSPTEISNFAIREFTEPSNGKEYNIRFVLHHNGTEAELDSYFDKVKAIVQQEKAVFGELPDFDYGEYTFLACYAENASGDGMEHRNSTILTSSRSLAKGGMEGNIGTVSHEFFHAWNVERIRPKSLEPFNFAAANMSEALWFAEGFTSYYTGLVLCRAGIISQKKYIEGLAGTFNYVWNSPARNYFNPIEMSYQAPFVDAAKSVDPVNRENTFISYYSYGSALGLALDLALRNEKKSLNLDGYMQLLWQKYGKTELAYTIDNLQSSLREYAGAEFATAFFSNYIYQSQMPDYHLLFESVGVQLSQDHTKAYFGASLSMEDGMATIERNTFKGSPSYMAGLEKGDSIISINGQELSETKPQDLFNSYAPGELLTITFMRFGQEKSVKIRLTSDPMYSIQMLEKVKKKILTKRNNWLNSK